MKTPNTASKTDCTNQPLLFQDLYRRKVVADFSGGTLSSDGGALLLRQVDKNLGLTMAVARDICLARHHAHTFTDAAGKPAPQMMACEFRKVVSKRF